MSTGIWYPIQALILGQISETRDEYFKWRLVKGPKLLRGPNNEILIGTALVGIVNKYDVC